MRRRLLAAVALIATEYFLISAAIDVRDLRFLAGGPSWLPQQFKRIGPLAVCVLTALVLLGGRGLREALRAEPGPPPWHRRVLLCSHLAAYATFVGLTVALARESLVASVLSVSLWVLLGLAASSTLLVLVIPSSLASWAKSAGARVTLAGLAAGALSLIAGVIVNNAWRHLAYSALSVSSWLLALVGRDVRIDMSDASLQVGNFKAIIEPACSGVEGMGLMAVLVGTYLFAFRRELRFPAALLLVPISVLLAFLANSIRIAALMVVGSEVSVHVASSGFHSKAGWVVFCLAAAALIYASRRWLARREESAAPRNVAPLIEGDVAGYIVPELCLLGTALFTGLWAVDIDRWMALRFVAAGIALAWLSRSLLASLKLRLSAIAVGVGTYLAWIALVKHDTHDAVYEAFLRTHGSAEVTAFLVMRVVGSVLLVPIAEELAFRGFLARWPSSANFAAVRPAAISVQGVFLSSVVFGVLHSDMLAGVVAGLAYCLLYRKTENIIDPIVAHAVTNGLIAVEVLALGHYGRW